MTIFTLASLLIGITAIIEGVMGFKNGEFPLGLIATGATVSGKWMQLLSVIDIILGIGILITWALVFFDVVDENLRYLTYMMMFEELLISYPLPYLLDRFAEND